MAKKSTQEAMQPLTPATAISPGGILAHDFSGPSWDRWRAVLKAAYAEPMTEDEITLFREVADRDPPNQPVKELWIVAGRRAGKDSIAAAIATTAALGDFKPFLRTGERATVMCLASDREQAGIVHRYIAGYFRELPALAQLVQRETETMLELKNDVDVMVATNNLRAPRGRTVAVAILDEVAYWAGADSASPDTETFAAIEPATLTIPNSLIIGISSPHRRKGLLFQKWTQYYGKNDDDVLVIRGPSKTFNPTLPDRIIQARIEADPEAGAAEYLAEWRGDVSDFVDAALISAAVDPGVAVRPADPMAEYTMFIDASGGRGSSFAAAVAHTEGPRVVIDTVYELRAPFDPSVAVRDVAALAAEYRIPLVRGDKYAAAWVAEAFRDQGLEYVPSDRTKSELFLAVLPQFTAGRISLVDNPRLSHQLTSLERTASKLGRDTVAAPRGGADDLANVVAGAAVNAVADGPALVKQGTILANTVPYPDIADSVFSVTVVGQDGVVATCYFSLCSIHTGIGVPELILLDCEMAPLRADSLREIAKGIRAARDAIKRAPPFWLAWLPESLKAQAVVDGLSFEFYDAALGRNLPEMAVRFATFNNAGRFALADAVREKGRTLPLASALSFRPFDRIESNTLRLAVLFGVEIGLGVNV